MVVETGAGAKSVSKSRRKKCASTAVIWVVVLEMKLAEAKVAHARLFDVAGRSWTDANKAHPDLEGLKIRVRKAKQQANLATASPGEAREMSTGSVKTTDEAQFQLTEISSQSQLYERKIGFLMMLIGNSTKHAMTRSVQLQNEVGRRR